MKTINLRAQRFRYTLKTFSAVFIISQTARFLTQGAIPFDEIFSISKIGASLVVTFILSLFSMRSMDVLLSESTLQAPVRKGFRLKSMTIDLSEVVLSRGRLNWFLGSQLSLKNGENFRISVMFYSRKEIQKLFDEIEVRQRSGATHDALLRP